MKAAPPLAPKVGGDVVFGRHNIIASLALKARFAYKITAILALRGKVKGLCQR